MEVLLDSIFVADYCTLLVNGSKIQLSRRSLRLTRKELEVLLHTYADIVWQRYCLLHKKTTMGTEPASQQRSQPSSQRPSLSQTETLSDLC